MDQAARTGGLPGNKQEECGGGEKTDRDDCPEGGSPAEGLAQRSTGGNSEDVGEGEAGEHKGDGLGSLIALDEIGGDDTADAKEGSVAERGKDTGGEEQVVARRDGASEIAECKDSHEQEESEFALKPGGGDRYERGAYGDAERVARDESSRFRDGDVEAFGEVRKQAHDDEFGGADAEGRDGQCSQWKTGEDASGLRLRRWGDLREGFHRLIATQVLSRAKWEQEECRPEVLGSIALCWNFLHLLSM